jgi:hypothetical protein
MNNYFWISGYYHQYSGFLSNLFSDDSPPSFLRAKDTEELFYFISID